MTVDEPTTVLTDAVLAGLCVVLGMRLVRLGRLPGRRAAREWGGALLALAAAAALGSLWHAFARSWPEGADAVLWRATLLSIGVAGFLFLVATLRAAVRDDARRRGTAVAAAFYGGWLVTVAFDDAFLWAIVAYVPALAVAFTLLGLRGHPSIAAGVVTTVVGSVVQLAGIAPHERFNHNDLYHVIQMAAVVLFYRGGRDLVDRDATRGASPPHASPAA